MDEQAFTLELTQSPAPLDVKRVTDGLIEFNTPFSGEEDYLPLSVFLRDARGEIQGGVVAVTFWGWLHVDVLWVDERLRGQGLGKKLMLAAEQEAARRGCRFSQLETHDFQALPFYQKLGYRVFGELPEFPKGYRKYFLVKEL